MVIIGCMTKYYLFPIWRQSGVEKCVEPQIVQASMCTTDESSEKSEAPSCRLKQNRIDAKRCGYKIHPNCWSQEKQTSLGFWMDDLPWSSWNGQEHVSLTACWPLGRLRFRTVAWVTAHRKQGSPWFSQTKVRLRQCCHVASAPKVPSVMSCK